MAPAGRPPISGERKDIRFIMMLNAEERSQLDAAAKITDQPTSTWARDVLLAAAAELTAAQSAPRKKTARRS